MSLAFLNHYRPPPQRMVSGQAVQSQHLYHEVKDSLGRSWLYAHSPNAGDFIYVQDKKPPPDKSWAGFGGATLTFPLFFGGEVVLQGPWHSNSAALKKNTGVDLTDRHLTWGLFSRARCWGDATGTFYRDVLYMDPLPTIGAFDRVPKLAQEYANRDNTSVFVYKETHGGSSSCKVDPEG